MSLLNSQGVKPFEKAQAGLSPPGLLKIQDLPHLKAIPDLDGCLGPSDCVGGYAATDTFAETGLGYASAGAIAFASGEYALTKTRTVAVVRQMPRVTISRASATAVAISVTPDGIDRSFSRSRSVSVCVS